MLIMAVLTSITGMIKYDEITYGLIEGVAIAIVLAMVVAIGAANDYMKDKQFLDLLSDVKDEEIPVIRGKYGATQSVNVFELVVGDIILLETGSRVPADCLLVEGEDVICDENFYIPGPDPVYVKKAVATESTISRNPDPFLLSNTLVSNGYGKAVVLAVG